MEPDQDGFRRPPNPLRQNVFNPPWNAIFLTGLLNADITRYGKPIQRLLQFRPRLRLSALITDYATLVVQDSLWTYFG